MDIFNLSKKYLNEIDISKPHIFLKVKEEEKCLARLWGNGDYGNIQCSRSRINNCYCAKHNNSSIRMGGTWWLGLINEERPENPVHPLSGKHSWTKDKDGNEYIKEKVDEIKPVEVITEKKQVKGKRKRGRPKGSKNKKK